MFLSKCLNFFVFHVQAITSSGTKKGELFLADVSTQLKNKNITTDIKVDTNSNVSHKISFKSSIFTFLTKTKTVHDLSAFKVGLYCIDSSFSFGLFASSLYPLFFF